jgi:hypothetical protein
VIPIFVGRPLVALEALSEFPLLAALRANAGGLKGIPKEKGRRDRIASGRRRMVSIYTWGKRISLLS